MPRYYLFLFFTCLFQFSIAQEWGNPYLEKFNAFQNVDYETALNDVKAGKTVKALSLYQTGRGSSLAPFTEVERITVVLSADSVKMIKTFEELSLLPKLQYLIITSYNNSAYLPKNISKLTNLKGVSFLTHHQFNTSFLWQALPEMKALETLQLSFPNNITALPNEIRNCKNLKSLSLSVPFLMTLPEWLSELSSLEYLQFSALYNNPNRRALSDIQPILAKLSSLKSLQIDNFALKGSYLMTLNPSTQILIINNCKVADSNIFFESINKAPSVEKLSLMNLQIQPPLPEIKLRLPNLKHLTITSLYTDSLQKNRWEGIPDGLVESSQLKFLDLGNVLGENLPKGIENLVELESLNLSNNRLKELPDLGRLTQLKSLTVSNNQLKQLPKSISKLLKLEALYIAQNLLDELPDEIFNSPELRYIYVGNNELSILPNALTKLKKLAYLDASFNRLKELPKNIGDCSQLQQLQLSGNELKNLPNSIGKLKRLTNLNLFNNPLAQLPETIGDCDRLSYLKMSNCALTSLPTTLGKLRQLKFLSVQNSASYQNPPVRSEIETKYPVKNHNQLRSLPIALVNCQQLSTLDLMGNPSLGEKTLWPTIQQFRLPMLTINLSNCQLDSIPMTGWHDTQLANLQLGSNQLTQLPTDWFKTKGIKQLALFNNKLPPVLMNYSSFEERLLIGEEMGIDVPKPFPDTKEMARAYLNQARQKMNTGDIPKFVSYMKEVERIDVTEGRWATELWGRFYFHSHQYRRAVDSLTVVIDSYFKTIKEAARPAQRGLPVAPMIDFRGQAKWRLGDSLGAIKDYEMMVEDYKLFAPNLWGRLGVWYKLYRPTSGKSGAAFDKAIGMYEMVRNQPPMVQMSAAEVYLLSEQPDKAYEYMYGLNQDNYKPDEKILAEYLLLCAQIVQKKANESELRAFESKLKKLEFKVKNWSYQLLEDSLSAWSLEKEYIEQLRQLTKAMKVQSVVVD